MNIRRYIVPGTIAAVVVAVLFYAFRPQPLMVDGAPVERGPLQIVVEEEARTRVIDRFVVSAPVAGYLQRITLRAGDAVRAGAPLLVIEPMPSDVLDPRARAAAEAGGGGPGRLACRRRAGRCGARRRRSRRG